MNTQFDQHVKNLAADLWQAGLEKGDAVALMLPAGYRKVLARYAIQACGAIVFDLDSPHRVKNVVALVVQDQQQLDKIEPTILRKLKFFLAVGSIQIPAGFEKWPPNAQVLEHEPIY